MRVTVFHVIGYEYKTPEGNFLESCSFWVYADTAKAAIERVKTYGVTKKYFDILEVIEKVEDATT